MKENAILDIPAPFALVVVKPEQDTVVGVDTLGVGKAQIVFAIAILVGDKLEPFLRLPQELPSQTDMPVSALRKTAIR